MKGVILAGGTGSRLGLSTKVTNKHLLPIYDKPMILYPLEVLRKNGIDDILIVSGKEHSGHFVKLLGSGKEYGVRFQYAVQETAGGIAQALGLAEDFADQGPLAVILGDNIYEHPPNLRGFTEGARIYLKEVPDPQRFGVASLDAVGKTVVRIAEKPTVPETNYAVTGLYLYDPSVFTKIRALKPSTRNELEITDVNNLFIKDRAMAFEMVEGWWTDAGTPESLFRASALVRQKHLQEHGRHGA